MKKPCLLLTFLVAIAFLGCHQGGSSTPPSASGAVPRPNFEIACGAPTTATTSELRCVRTDTRSGDVLVVTI